MRTLVQAKMATLVVIILIASLLYQVESSTFVGRESKVTKRKRSILTFPTDSLFQINMGIALAEEFEKNSAAIVLAFQQNAKLPTEPPTGSLVSEVVTAKKFSIYGHLKDVMNRYGFNGVECLKKMICQVAETPMTGGLLEEIITFVLKPSKHRNLVLNDKDFTTENPKKPNSLLESEALGVLGGNCSFLFPRCVRTPLDVVSSFIYL